MPWHSTSKAEGVEVAVRYKVVKRAGGIHGEPQPALITIDNNNVNIVGPAWIAQRLIFAAAAAAAATPRSSHNEEEEDEISQAQATQAATKAFLQSVDEDVVLEVVSNNVLSNSNQVTLNGIIKNPGCSAEVKQEGPLSPNSISRVGDHLVNGLTVSLSNGRVRPPLRRLKAIWEAEDNEPQNGDIQMINGEEQQWFLVASRPSSRNDQEETNNSSRRNYSGSLKGFRRKTKPNCARTLSLHTKDNHCNGDARSEPHDVRILSIESFQSQQSIDETGLTTGFHLSSTEPLGSICGPFFSYNDEVFNTTVSKVINGRAFSSSNPSNNNIDTLSDNVDGSRRFHSVIPTYYNEIKATSSSSKVKRKSYSSRRTQSMMNGYTCQSEDSSKDIAMKIFGAVAGKKEKRQVSVPDGRHPVELEGWVETPV